MTGRALVLGLGNSAAGDDGIGAAVASALRRRAMAGVRVEIEPGDASNLWNHWRGERSIWLIDAFDWGGPPGSSRILREREILALPQAHEGAHRLSLPECLRWLRQARPELRFARIHLVGVQPRDLTFGASLSIEVAAALPRVVRLLERRLTAHARRVLRHA